jgi:hypothetical protein
MLEAGRRPHSLEDIMSDFHRSLDRSLETDPHNHWGVTGDALADLLSARAAIEPPREPLIDWGVVVTPIVDAERDWLDDSVLEGCVIESPRLCDAEIPAEGTE